MEADTEAWPVGTKGPSALRQTCAADSKPGILNARVYHG